MCWQCHETHGFGLGFGKGKMFNATTGNSVGGADRRIRQRMKADITPITPRKDR